MGWRLCWQHSQQVCAQLCNTNLVGSWLVQSSLPAVPGTPHSSAPHS